MTLQQARPTTAAARTDRPGAADREPGPGTILLVVVLAGVALGLGDLAWMTRLPWPWLGLANTSAPWALSAFLLGAALRCSPGRAAVAAVVMELVAVETYYLGAAHVGMADLATLWSPSTRMWLAFGVVAGVVWGAAGAWFRSGPWWAAGLALGSAAGVLGGEALFILGGLVLHPSFASEVTGTGWALAAIGAGCLLLAVVRPRPVPVLLTAAVVAVPAVLGCAAAFALAGFGM